MVNITTLNGEIGLLQVIGKNYFRVRIYDGYSSIDKKPKFHYIVVTKDYVIDQLRTQNLTLDQLQKGKRETWSKHYEKSLVSQIEGAGSLVRIGRKPPKLAVVGSNPTPPA